MRLNWKIPALPDVDAPKTLPRPRTVIPGAAYHVV
jgi:hypothetical protein